MTVWAAHPRWLFALPVALVVLGQLSATRPLLALALALGACGAAWVSVSGVVAVSTWLIAALPWLIVFLDPIPDEMRTLAAALGAGLAFLAVLARSRPSSWLIGGALLLVPGLMSLPTTSTAGAFQFLHYLVFVALVGLLASEGGATVTDRISRVALPSACAAMLVHAVVVAAGLGDIGTYYGSGERLGYAASPHNLAFFASGAGIAAFLRFERATFRYGFFALGVSITLLTGARSAMLGLVLFTMLLVFRRGARLQQVAVLVAATAAVAVTGAGGILTERLLESEQSGEFQQLSSAGSGRGEIWANALARWQDAGPEAWLTGTGLRTITGFSEQAFGRPLFGHSDLIEIGVQLGVVGFAGYLVLVVLILRSASARLVLAMLATGSVLNGTLEYIAPLTLMLIFAGGSRAIPGPSREGRPSTRERGGSRPSGEPERQTERHEVGSV